MQRKVLSRIKQLQSRFNMKIDPLLLTEEEFFHLLVTQELNPVKEMFWYKTILFNPHTFWIMVRRHLQRNENIASIPELPSPQEIDTTDLIYNLYRFGYTELGSEVKQGKNIAVEYIVTSILLRNEARKIQAIPILLAKNEVNYNLLLFLAKKYDIAGKLLGLLQTLEKVKKTKVISNTIRTMTMMNIEAKSVAEKSILEKMKMYNVY